jgi:hypothetical protein
MGKNGKAKARKRTTKDLAPRGGKTVKGGQGTLSTSPATRSSSNEHVYFSIKLENTRST